MKNNDAKVNVSVPDSLHVRRQGVFVVTGVKMTPLFCVIINSLAKTKERSP